MNIEFLACIFFCMIFSFHDKNIFKRATPKFLGENLKKKHRKYFKAAVKKFLDYFSLELILIPINYYFIHYSSTFLDFSFFKLLFLIHKLYFIAKEKRPDADYSEAPDVKAVDRCENQFQKINFLLHNSRSGSKLYGPGISD